MTRWLALACFLLWLPGLTVARADAARPFLLSPDQDMVELARQVDYLADPSGRLTIADVSGPAWSERFRPLPGGASTINFGYSPDVYWLRFTLASTAPRTVERWLEVGYFSLEHITLYPPHAQPITTGNALPFVLRPIPHRYFVIPIQVSDQPATFYLEVRSAGSLTIPLRLWRPAAFATDSASSYAAMALYYGALAALLLYNLLLYLSLGERSYLIYCLFVASMACGQLALTGFGNQYLWTDRGPWNRIGSDVAFCAVGVFGLWFARSFLASGRTMPRLDRLLAALIAVFTLDILYLLAYDLLTSGRSTGSGAILLSVTGVVGCMAVVVAGVLGLRRGHGGARVFLGAWTVLLLGAALAALRNLDWVPTNGLTSHGLQIGSALEMLLLSFALADRIHGERRAREAAQAETLAARQMLVERLEQAERSLEFRISQRTTELAEANARLRHNEQRLEEIANQDPLTGTANRRLLEERTAQARAAADQRGVSIALLLIDLDRFKPVNDRHGHAVGDEVLRGVAERIRAEIRGSDTVARIGGDEFVVLLERVRSAEDAGRVAAKLIASLTAPFRIEGLHIQIGASIGIALYPEHSSDTQTLRQYADIAMYQAKQAGGNRYQLFDRDAR